MVSRALEAAMNSCCLYRAWFAMPPICNLINIHLIDHSYFYLRTHLAIKRVVQLYFLFNNVFSAFYYVEIRKVCFSLLQCRSCSPVVGRVFLLLQHWNKTFPGYAINCESWKKISKGFAKSCNSFHIVMHEGDVKLMIEYLNRRLCRYGYSYIYMGGDISVVCLSLWGMHFICSMWRIAEGISAAISGTLSCLCGLFRNYCFFFFLILLLLQQSVGGRAEMV